MALLVAVAAIIGGVLYMKQQQNQAKPKQRGRPKKAAAPTTPTAPSTHTSPKIAKRTARGTGSVQTPSGRRSARIARKSIE